MHGKCRLGRAAIAGSDLQRYVINSIGGIKLLRILLCCKTGCITEVPRPSRNTAVGKKGSIRKFHVMSFTYWQCVERREWRRFNGKRGNCCIHATVAATYNKLNIIVSARLVSMRGI